jgi:hypothetical protein
MGSKPKGSPLESAAGGKNLDLPAAPVTSPLRSIAYSAFDLVCCECVDFLDQRLSPFCLGNFLKRRVNRSAPLVRRRRSKHLNESLLPVTTDRRFSVKHLIH